MSNFDWLKCLRRYVEDTEAPRKFWLWGGLFTIASALERKVWLPFGLDAIYPNLYIMLVAPPGKCRKGSAISLSKKFLAEVGVSTFVDSPTKRALTKQMAENAANQFFTYEGTNYPMSSICLISSELSSFLATDPKGMIEILTDVWESQDVWKYKTSEKGEDKLYNLCVSCFLASTPSWIAANLPEEAIGGGLTSRLIIVSGDRKYKRIAIPEAPDQETRNLLLTDLCRIKSLVGEFKFDKEAEDYYKDWYDGMGEMVKKTRDERLHSFLERIHVNMLKVAMCLRVSYSDDLTLVKSDIKKAIALLEDITANASTALAGHGRSSYSVDTEKVITQVKTLGRTTFKELLVLNYKNTNKMELEQILDTIKAMGLIEETTEGMKRVLTWKKVESFN